MKSDISPAIIRRLPRYYRIARQLVGNDILRISSAELAELAAVTPSQIRQDFRQLGGIGQQGYGYNVKDLYSRLGDLMGMNEMKAAVLVSDNLLGSALLEQQLLRLRGITLRACFGDFPADFPVECRPLEDFPAYCAENPVDMLILSVSRESAPALAEDAIRCGVRGIWNLSGCELTAENVVIHNINLSDDLLAFCYELNAQRPDRSRQE